MSDDGAAGANEFESLLERMKARHPEFVKATFQFIALRDAAQVLIEEQMPDPKSCLMIAAHLQEAAQKIMARAGMTGVMYQVFLNTWVQNPALGTQAREHKEQHNERIDP